ncbi:hypothetical protein SLA2020_519110 [Shorea laevis]
MVDLVGHARHLDGVALVDAVSFSSPQYRGNGAPREIESHRSWRHRSSTTDMGPVMTDNNNHLFASNHVPQPFQQAIMDGDALIWSQASAHLYMHGSNAGGRRETGHRSPVTFLHSTPHFQLTDYNTSMHQHVAGPHHLPLSHVAHNSMNSHQTGLEMGPRHLLPILSHRSRVHHSRQEGRLPEASQRHGNFRHLRLLPPEDVAVLELSGDMHLDIENASYEELLALGEQIGSAKTGLSEEIITTKLKTRTFSLSATNIDMEETATLGQEPDVCIICQEEYKNQDIIGTLSCRHEYHADCLKKWLLQKNECPMCRSRGLTLD